MAELLTPLPQRLQSRVAMAFSPGARLGPYEILCPLGAGGMGEVYRARDRRLGRELAIKVLPTDLAATRERLERFEREARSASALNHPNIVTIYELAQADSIHYIAMELVEGKTLREMLVSPGISVQKAIQIAAQVADGLAKAHEAGIIHRDLKPENIMVSDDGLVKILDFGLAKLASLAEELSESRTSDGSRTQPGVVMGTFEYMSPEQANGKPLDFHSDQFSFGSVLYEMVTGKRAFQRSTGTETLVALLRDQPPHLGTLNQEAPAPLCWVIERCLAKDPGKRYDSTRDLARDLVAIRDGFLEVSARRVEVRPSNLPPQRTAFVGRDREVAGARELLLRPDVRLVTITGPGGIGKTRLGLQVASELSGQFPGGVYFVPLAVIKETALIPSLIAQTLGARDTGGQQPLETLKEYLQSSLQGPTLLLLDNFEHLVGAAPTLSRLLALSAPLKLLVTSRAALRIYGEHEFPVPPMALPDSRSLPPLEALSNYSAIALFVERAKAVKPDFEITQENAPAITEICARLDGLPLAIELAAARIKLLSPSAMQTRLASRLQLLTGGARDLPARQQTLRGAIDWSYDLLNPAEQKLFRRLSAFVGGCTLEGVEAVCDTKSDLGLDLLDGMASMVDKSLLQQVEHAEGDTRFVMLETIREYALEKLAASGEDTVTRRAHAAYCLVLAEEQSSTSGEAAQSDSFDLFETEHDNFRAALDWLIQTENTEWGLRLGAALFRFWETRDHLSEGRDRLAKLLRLKPGSAPTPARTRVLFAAGVLSACQGDYGSARDLFQASMEHARKLNDEWAAAIALNGLAVNASDRGEIEASRSLAEENVRVWKELGDQAGVARALSNLAKAVKMQGDFALARSLYEECFSIFQHLDDKSGMAWSLNYQGDVAREQDDISGAEGLYRAALDIFRKVDDRWGIAGCLADLGSLICEQRDHAGSESLFGESIKLFDSLGHKRGIARLLECFACSSAAQDEYARALRLAGAAAALRRSVGAPLPRVEQVKLDSHLDRARQVLTHSAAAAAWMEGWVMPIESAVQYALRSEPTSKISHAETRSSR